MELRHLRYFVAVAKTCHFGQAAAELHIAQPALSQAIRQLEAELGAELLIRTTRQARLTPAGELLQREAQRILNDVHTTVEDVRHVASGRLGVLRLGLTGTAAVSHLPQIARVLRAALPDLSLDIHADLLTPTQCDGLRDGVLDLGVLRPPTTGRDISSRVIAVEPLRLALPAGHRLVDAEIIDMTDLAHEPFVLYVKPSSAVNLATIRSCERAGFAPSSVHRAPDTPVVLSLVAAGAGIALVPDGAGRTNERDVVFRDVTGAEHVQLALAWREGNSSAVVARVLDALEHADIFDPVHEAVTR